MIQPMSFATRLFRPLRRLRWKLTLSYTLITVVTLLILELLVATVLLAVAGSTFFGNLIHGQFQTEFAPTVGSYLQAQPLEADELQAWVEGHVNRRSTARLDGSFTEQEIFRVGNVSIDPESMHLWIIDADRNTVAEYSGASELTWQTIAEAESLVAEAFGADPQREDPLVTSLANGARLLALPAVAETTVSQTAVSETIVLGVILVRYRTPILFTRESVSLIVGVLLLTAVPLILVTAFIGALFGYLTSRSLSKRIVTLREAADGWSQGDFSRVAHDDSADELGDLSRHLNRMAEQLQNLVATQQELAAIETRNELARDLHDSVKQQIFAVTMQVGAAKTWLEQKPALAQEHLSEAEQLAKQSQQELTGLIQALRPPALEGKGLVDALRMLVANWSRQTQIPAELQIQGEQPLPLPVEIVLYRVAQEALSNVSRHSQATAVQVQLKVDEKTIQLGVVDNGLGFETGKETLGVGLKSMAERLERTNGRLQLTSAPHEGTAVLAIVRNETDD
ncbi:MAG: sensor histidine kinase [Chloroflexota bacterium]